jgi:monoterpene epsilon-lactone hydrolase
VPSAASRRRRVRSLRARTRATSGSRLAAHLAAATGCPVHVLDHRRSPEHQHPAAVDDAERALVQLPEGRTVALAGDSAGGSLVVLLATRLRDAGRPRPAVLGLVSPMADLTLETSRRYVGPDPVLRQAWLQQGVDAFAGTADRRTLSPVHLPLHDPAPVVLQLSSDERLRPEGERLAAALRAAGNVVELEVLARLWHDVHLQPSLVPEGAAAVARLGRRLRERMDAA